MTILGIPWALFVVSVGTAAYMVLWLFTGKWRGYRGWAMRVVRMAILGILLITTFLIVTGRAEW